MPPSLPLQKFRLSKTDLTRFSVQTESPAIKMKRDRIFLPPVPERLFCRLSVLPGKALHVYMVLMLRSNFNKARTVTLTTTWLRRFRLTRNDKTRALQVLKKRV